VQAASTSSRRDPPIAARKRHYTPPVSLRISFLPLSRRVPFPTMAFALPAYAGLYAWLVVTLYIVHRIRRSLR